MKYPLWSIALVSVLFSTCGNADEIKAPHIRNWQALDSWMVRNAQCRDDFMMAVQDAHFMARVKSLGITMVDVVYNDQPPSGMWILPRPIDFYGFKVDRLHYWGDSGSEFYFDVPASPAQVKKVMKAGGLAAEIRQDGHYLAGIVAQPKSTNTPSPDLIFIRQGSTHARSEVGCRTFDD